MKRLVAIVLISAILISPGGAGTFVHAKAADSAAELPESSPSSPPLETDDPGTPGRQGYEINFSVNRNVTALVAGEVSSRRGSGMEGSIEISLNGRTHSEYRYRFAQQEPARLAECGPGQCPHC